MRSREAVAALVQRAFLGTFIDFGRIADLIVFPLSFLVIWGLLVYSGLLPADVGEQLLLINLIWALSSSFQLQSNYSMMYDLWSLEFPEILRAGVKPRDYFIAMIIFGLVIGLFNVVVFMTALTTVFSLSLEKSLLLVTTLPIYGFASMGLAAAIAGCVLRLGRSYAFLSWTTLQIVIMLSSPYSPIDSLPWIMQRIAWLSPYGGLFEYVRTPNSLYYGIALAEAIVMFVAGYMFFLYMFENARKKGRLLLL